MVAKRNPHEGLTYEEQVAIARANLERGIEEHRKRVEAFRAEHGDPHEALMKFVLETFSPDGMRQSLNEWRQERGKDPIDDSW